MERCCTLEKRAILGNHHTTAETPQCETAAWEIIQPKSETMLNCKAASRNSYKWREAWHVAANRKGKTKQKKSCFHFNASCRGATKHRTDHLRCIITILISPLISKSEILGKGSHKIAGIWKAFSDWEPDGTNGAWKDQTWRRIVHALTLWGTPAQRQDPCWVWRPARVLCRCRRRTFEECSCTWNKKEISFMCPLVNERIETR